MQQNSIKIIGQMSGTSLDGLDLALCEFYYVNDKIKFKLLESKTISYDLSWKNKLDHIFKANAEEYFKLNYLYGKYLAEQIRAFQKNSHHKAELLALHGHTIFHQPQHGFTTQIGCGATVAALTNTNTINQFRNMDVAYGGQGAPLVPIGDRDLFNDYESCLNIGGIANLSFTKNNTTNAFDICLANMPLNYLAEQLNKRFDEGGEIAALGVLNTELFTNLLAMDYQNKSIGREFFEDTCLNLINNNAISVADRLATCCEYTAITIANTLNKNKLNSVLITGGGVYNKHLISRVKKYYNGTIEIPSDEIIQFKEAIIFAYLGFLTINKQVNSLKSVTGAQKDSIGGAIHFVK